MVIGFDILTFNVLIPLVSFALHIHAQRRPLWRLWRYYRYRYPYSESVWVKV